MTDRTAESGQAWCGHFSLDIDGNCFRCTDLAQRQALMAQAWDECARDSHNLGWLHDWALSDVIARNPYRLPIPPESEAES